MAMVIDPEAGSANLDEQEVSQILSLLPPYEGKFVVELGSGVGPFTGELAKKAEQVVVLDVVESVANKSELGINEQLKNVEFICADLASPPDLGDSANSVDLIFANRRLMYLSDQEVETLAVRMVQWLRPGGFIFFRESCLDPSGSRTSKSKLIHYREPRFYTKVFKECHTQDESGNSHELSLICCKSINAADDICWIWQKLESKDDKGFQRFLDTVQYKFKDILRYERVFGPGFVSPGGLETTRDFVSKLDLKTSQKVLDVGCGIGGVDFYMAQNFGVEVVGIDLSVNMISLALERAVGLKCAVQFEVADCTTKTYPDNTFDVIYSRDTILHIQDKPSLFRSFYNWLKPGGKVLITDYCKRAGSPSPEFAAYIDKRGYDLHDVHAYGQMLKDAGFYNVVAEDRTSQFIEILQKELDAVEKDKDGFVTDFSEGDYNDIVDGWKAKLIRSESGEQQWGLFIAEKNV